MAPNLRMQMVRWQPALWLGICVALGYRGCDADTLHRGQILVTDILTVSSNLTCSGSTYHCLCKGDQTKPKPRYQLNITLSLPSSKAKACNGESCEYGSPIPLVLFFHGFGGEYVLSTPDYQPYADAATSGGAAMLQYDVVGGGGLVEVVIDAVELQFVPQILQWVAQQNNNTESPAYQQIDLGSIAVAGHSRGGKMAALAFATPGIVPDAYAAFLIDPVDCPCFAPCSSNCYPSGLAAVAAAKKPLGVAGATVKGCCNPRGSSNCSWTCQLGCKAATGNGTCTGFDYQDFLYQAGGGSRGYTQDAGHLQFAAITSPIIKTLGNVFCGCDSHTTSEDISAKAAEEMMRWFDKEASQRVDIKIAGQEDTGWAGFY